MIKFGQVTPVSVRVDSKLNLLSKQNSANALTTAAAGIVDAHHTLAQSKHYTLLYSKHYTLLRSKYYKLSQ